MEQEELDETGIALVTTVMVIILILILSIVTKNSITKEDDMKTQVKDHRPSTEISNKKQTPNKERKTVENIKKHIPTK